MSHQSVEQFLPKYRGLGQPHCQGAWHHPSDSPEKTLIFFVIYALFMNKNSYLDNQ
ncbi:hypothetical protein DJ39_54 [Yersinia ruckeri ATCC 29473]|uniref:Uncharacterized protein n=1 Tax=Yersinia ruckeri TaxID=29486 RepID=A0A085U3F3_YERRU|nr:hypothetical protein QMA0440_00504 [Yersinia ruckeri]KGA49544.1 hypothetical protein DJ39_54 [Yersinia ruckeri ATCC 29473]KFE37716.1 hypothetical protein nADLYRO1b_2929 [Yersinia ruckeri]QTD77875.1 Uncharacterized protein YR821_2959 [Yersinia ruckeri]CEK28798.1 hypothetical protein CSF007_15375 [Yersinia ruckeri]